MPDLRTLSAGVLICCLNFTALAAEDHTEYRAPEVGMAIADQGNLALARIRASLIETIPVAGHLVLPELQGSTILASAMPVPQRAHTASADLR